MIQKGIMNHFALFMKVFLSAIPRFELPLKNLSDKNINSYAHRFLLHILLIMHTTDNIIHFVKVITFL